MSQHNFNLPDSGRVTLDIDGHVFTVDFDDAELLRRILDVHSKIVKVTDSGKDFSAQVNALLAFSDEAKGVIEQAFGDGAYETLFGEARPIVRVMFLITKLAELAGPVYDGMFNGYRN